MLLYNADILVEQNWECAFNSIYLHVTYHLLLAGCCVSLS